jgi:predicted Fe-Mo cluster-binding NifX family protein
MLADSKVDVVVAGEIGPGTTTLLEQYKIKKN